MAKEACQHTDIPQFCVSVKCDLFIWEERPVCISIPPVCQQINRSLLLCK